MTDLCGTLTELSPDEWREVAEEGFARALSAKITLETIIDHRELFDVSEERLLEQRANLERIIRTFEEELRKVGVEVWATGEPPDGVYVGGKR